MRISLIQPPYMFTFEKADSEDSEEDKSITLAEIVVKMLTDGRLCVMLTHLFTVIWRSQTTHAKWQTKVGPL